MEIISFAATSKSDEEIPAQQTAAEPNEEAMPQYIENTDLSLTRLVPKQNKKMGSLSSLQWTFIILIVGAILFYGGIMFIASNSKPNFIPAIVDTATGFVEPEATTENEEIVAAPSEAVIEQEDTPLKTASDELSSATQTETEISDNALSFFQRIQALVLTPKIKDEEETKVVDESTPIGVISPIMPKEDVSSQKGNTINALLNLASTQIKSEKLTSPTSDNAVDTYRMVLQLDPENKSAREGIEAIRVRYLIWAEKAAVAGDSGKAQHYLEQAVQLSPDNFK